MMLGRTNAGGGGSRLNFKIITAAEEPQNPQENTIWVNTETELTDWQIGPEAPTTRGDGTALSGGEIWISTGTGTTNAFSVLYSKSIVINPTGAYQYTEGAWAPVDVKYWQNGSWGESIAYLYNDGDTCDGLTGGWIGKKFAAGYYTYGAKPGITLNVDNLVASAPQYTAGDAYSYEGALMTASKIDLAPYSELHFKGTIVKPQTGTICVWSELGSKIGDNRTTIYSTAVSDDEITIDISSLDAAGGYYIGFTLKGEYTVDRVTMKQMWLE